MEKTERRHIRLPAESVSLCAENLGIQTSQEVTNSVVEDVSFRIRQLTDAATQFMHHAKRRRLLVEDFDKAMKWSSIEPLYGHSASQPPDFQSIHESGLFSLHDPDVKMTDTALSPPPEPHTLPNPPSIQAAWLTIEGVPVGKESGDHHECAGVIEVKSTPNESHQQYLSLLMEAICGEAEDVRRVALTDVQTNPSIANILPDLVQYLQETLSNWVQFTPLQLLRILKLLLAIFRNTSLFLDPYALPLFPPMKSIVLNASYLHVGEGFDHWHVRHMAAICLAEIIRYMYWLYETTEMFMARCGSPLSDYLPDLYSSFHQLLAQQEVPLPVLYSTILTLCHMGGKSVYDVLLPRLDAVTGYVQSLLELTEPQEQESALRVYETLLFSAELVLTSDTPHHLVAPSGDAHRPPPGNDTSFFGLGGGKSIMASMDSGEMSGVGETVKDLPTLYDYLVDMFGERLSLRLTGHQGFKATTTIPKPIEDTDRESRTNTSAPKDGPLMRFLSREGFRSTKVQLPQKVPQSRQAQPLPSSFGGRPRWTFPVPKPSLPVHSNILEKQKRRSKKPPSRRQAIPLKGGSPSYRRGASKSRVQPSDISSSWL